MDNTLDILAFGAHPDDVSKDPKKITFFSKNKYSAVELIEFNTGNILSRQIVFSLVGIVVFFLTTYLSIENLYNKLLRH